jgi:hypothetical protein
VRRRIIGGPAGTVTEDLSFGYHDGLRIVFERNAQGAFIKRAVTLDEQGSITAVTDATGYSHAEIHEDHGERVTVPQRRTGWLDRELDYETAPGHVRHKLYDLDHRKYDGATALFLSVDRNSAYLTINDPARLVLLVITRNSTRNTTQQVITVVR